MEAGRLAAAFVIAASFSSGPGALFTRSLGNRFPAEAVLYFVDGLVQFVLLFGIGEEVGLDGFAGAFSLSHRICSFRRKRTKSSETGRCAPDSIAQTYPERWNKAATKYGF